MNSFTKPFESWQKGLEDDDLYTINEYICDREMDTRNRQIALDDVAVEVIVSGMRAYGWEATCLFNSSNQILGPGRTWPSHLRKRNRSLDSGESLNASPVNEQALAADLSLTNDSLSRIP